jgi:hypothetical protein
MLAAFGRPFFHYTSLGEKFRAGDACEAIK